MRIMTYAVRQALAATTPEPNSGSQSSSDTSSPETSSAEHFIPCAGLCSTVPNSEEDLHRDKRLRSNTPPKVQPEKSASLESEVAYCGRDALQGELAKYWYQRNRLFWRFDEGIKLDTQSWYSVTPEAIARQIAERCRCKVIVDAFCGAGGNAIQFASTCSKVIAIDIDPNKILLAKHNAKVYGVADKIEFICTDFINWIQDQQEASVDVVFLSPPWGGIDYLSFNSPSPVKSTESSGYYPLTELKPLAGKELFTLTRRVTQDIALYLPRNVDMKQVASLVENHVGIEVEEAWMSSKCKAVTIYFGNLVVETARSTVA
ncbi:hypothetical protein CROQUDRAFT_69773 [Cronartium quercuum f. sp. fusiforme G11]|uniref:Trimethylguanosine synthase n=1 Tax=Cronartium quercuum f. sp. fusiforme G11 TaxID=708437 RepID=A0A9P6N902_9BASI|nr:hypothetical protein CROQUDRAFT_69773 [Cronartium quercuum f. sp. fusiforme G11]